MPPRTRNKAHSTPTGPVLSDGLTLQLGFRSLQGDLVFFRSVGLAIISAFVLPCTEGIGLEYRLYNEFGLQMSLILRTVPLCFLCALPTSGRYPGIYLLL